MCTENTVKKPIEIEITKRQMDFVSNQLNLSDEKNSTLTIDWDKEMEEILDDERIERKRSILAPVEDERTIYAEPMLRPTFNLAAYVRKSETLQQFIKLGVDLTRWDLLNCGEFIAKLDFKQYIEPYILLLTKDIGIPIDQLGKLFTKNPRIFTESLENIQVRVNYLGLKRFTRDEIVTIVTRNPNWLTYSTRDIDNKLGFFQKHFKLTGSEMRSVTVNCPKLITHDQHAVEQISFSIREECVFTQEQVKQLVLKVPKVWMMGMLIMKCMGENNRTNRTAVQSESPIHIFSSFSCLLIFFIFIGLLLMQFLFLTILDRYDLMRQYDYIIDHMKIDNEQLVKMPSILTNRLFRIKERHGFLKKIGRAQYNPKLALYVSLDDLCMGNDDEFCERIGKPYEEYDRYLRTL